VETSKMPTPNPTMAKFGYPASLIAETTRWSVQVRPIQATLGALVLVCREPVTAFSRVSDDAHGELKHLVERIERCLTNAFSYDKINWLMLMMVDLDVHFHVLPRYASARVFAGVSFADPGWPGVPNIGFNPSLTESTLDELTAHLTRVWAAAG
jgi:diadenosine tetraphosphate (Ap4A) HIT family hydrolase